MACDSNNTPPNQTDQPLFIHQGADFDATFTYQDPDGVAIDITGYSFEMEVVKVKPGGESAATWTTADGDFSITSAITGEFALRVVATETAAMQAGTYWFDLSGTTTGGAVYALAQGQIIVDPEA